VRVERNIFVFVELLRIGRTGASSAGHGTQTDADS
jgi:hypothetical protein